MKTTKIKARRLTACLIGVFLGLPALSSAHTVAPIVYSGDSFDGTGSTAGQFQSIYGLAIDTAHQKVYVMDQKNGGVISRFDMSGVPDPFSGLAGASSTAAGPIGFNNVGMAVDNSPGASGAFYAVTQQGGPIRAFGFDGIEKGGGFPLTQVSEACSIAVDARGYPWYATGTGHMVEVNPDTGLVTGNSVLPFTRPCQSAIDSEGHFYTSEAGGAAGSGVTKVDSKGSFKYDLDIPNGFQSVDGIVTDPSNDWVYVLYGEWVSYRGLTVYEFEPGNPNPVLELPVSGATAIAVDGLTHDIYVAEGGAVKIYEHLPPITVPDVTTSEFASSGSATTATLRGIVNPDGISTTDCHFEWGRTKDYGRSAPCAEGSSLGGDDDVNVTASVGGLVKGGTYHFRLVSRNANDFVVKGKDKQFDAQDPPTVGNEFVSDVHTESATVHSDVHPEGGITQVHVTIGTDTSYGTDTGHLTLPTRFKERDVRLSINGLEPGTEYHYRVVAVNTAGQALSGADHTFTTYPFVPVIADPCANALSRQQTGAALLLDCRAYELVSAANAGGYDVESDMVPGQEPFDGFPLADDRVLYGVHDGGIPGTGSPTNHGVDPYVATRGDTGWSTRYVGIPADGTPSMAPFSSTLLAADQDLDSFAFGGPSICAPCFADKTKGIPLRRGGADLAQGMAGTLDPGPSAEPDGLIAKPMSADGTHLVFGSVERFELDGNDGTGDVSIYDRNLETGVTQVVSKTPAGANLPCLQGAGACSSPGDAAGMAELAISTDGSRIVVAQRVSTDVEGNHYWHPYMHVGSSPNTVDLAPGTTTGVLFSGMTSDGSRVFLTTRDRLSVADTDSSADVYVVEVDGTGSVSPELISTDSSGNPSNSDSCLPTIGWNSASGAPSCDAVAFAGGAGVAAESGTFYFLSPELLAGASGELNQANLYVVRPGEHPDFVAVMDSSTGKPQEPASHPVRNPDFLTGLSSPQALAVNQATQDIYVAEGGAGRVSRFTATGTPSNFTSTPGSNTITGLSLGGPGEGQIAVDNAPHAPGSPFKEALYVTSNAGSVEVYANSGVHLGSVTGFFEACGVAVNQSTGVVYVGDYFLGITRLEPISDVGPVSDASYARTSIRITEGFSPCQVGADSEGHVYGAAWSQGPLKAFNAFEFDIDSPYTFGSIIAGVAHTMSADPDNSDLYVSAGNQINVFRSTGKSKEVLAAGGVISGSRGVAVNATTHRVYISTGSKVVELDSLPPQEPISNPAVLHGVSQAGTRSYGDFQVSADGRYAAYASAKSSTTYDSAGYYEVYRYDSQTRALDCASCPTTNARAMGDASLATHGLSLSEDGRVFFNSLDSLVLRDTDARKDAYEWSNGAIQLISPGTSPFGSGLLSVSSAGTDAFFFTRDTLAPGDHNGTTMKIYDAREGGGFFDIPAPPPCAASDECHGPGTEAGAPKSIGSLTSTPGNLGRHKKGRCKKGFVKKRSRCVKKRAGKRHGAKRTVGTK